MFYNISGLILDRLTVGGKVRQEQKKTFNRIVKRYRIRPKKKRRWATVVQGGKTKKVTSIQIAYYLFSM